MKQIVIDNISTTYYITPNGECYNSLTGNYLKGQVNSKNGYKSFYLRLPNGDKKRAYAHRLVAEAYLENPLGKPQVNHIDGNKLNNCVDNLEFVTQKENMQHCFAHGLGNRQHVFCFTKDKQIVAEYFTIAAASKSTGISAWSIQQALTQKVKSLCGNFYWSYSEELGPTKEYKNSGRAKPVNQYDKNGKYITTYASVGTAARAIQGQVSRISECCRGKLKSYKNCIWKYVDDIVSTSEEIQRGSQDL